MNEQRLKNEQQKLFMELFEKFGYAALALALFLGFQFMPGTDDNGGTLLLSGAVAVCLIAIRQLTKNNGDLRKIFDIQDRLDRPEPTGLCQCYKKGGLKKWVSVII